MAVRLEHLQQLVELVVRDLAAPFQRDEHAELGKGRGEGGAQTCTRTLQISMVHIGLLRIVVVEDDAMAIRLRLGSSRVLGVSMGE